MDPTPASPLLDGDLLAFSMKLPADYKLRRSRLRTGLIDMQRECLCKF
jgi:hypothetical protein